jgi:hypothetical protein
MPGGGAGVTLQIVARHGYKEADYYIAALVAAVMFVTRQSTGQQTEFNTDELQWLGFAAGPEA